MAISPCLMRPATDRNPLNLSRRTRHLPQYDPCVNVILFPCFPVQAPCPLLTDPCHLIRPVTFRLSTSVRGAHIAARGPSMCSTFLPIRLFPEWLRGHSSLAITPQFHVLPVKLLGTPFNLTTETLHLLYCIHKGSIHLDCADNAGISINVAA